MSQLNLVLNKIVDTTDTLTNKVVDITKKLNDKININSNDYTAFEVYANDVAYTTENTYRDVTALVDYVPEKYLDEKLAAAIPIGMTHRFRIRTSCPPANSDVTIDWGDGQSIDLSDTEADGVTINGPDSEKNIHILFSTLIKQQESILLGFMVIVIMPGIIIFQIIQI